MRGVALTRLILLALSVCALTSCAQRSTTAPASMSAATLDDFQRAAASAGYRPDAIEVMANAAHLRVLVRDNKLAEADQNARENAAGAIVAAIEQSPRASGVLGSLSEISVAIVHEPDQGTGGADSHIEDVLQFRKGPGGRFAHHLT